MYVGRWSNSDHEIQYMNEILPGQARARGGGNCVSGGTSDADCDGSSGDERINCDLSSYCDDGDGARGLPPWKYIWNLQMKLPRTPLTKMCTTYPTIGGTI